MSNREASEAISLHYVYPYPHNRTQVRLWMLILQERALKRLGEGPDKLIPNLREERLLPCLLVKYRRIEAERIVRAATVY